MALDTKTPLLSVALRKELKSIRITSQQKAFADLLAVGWNEKDAYMCTNLYNITYSAEVNWREMHALITENDNFKRYAEDVRILYDKRSNRSKRYDDEKSKELRDIDIKKKLTKEEQLKELYTALGSAEEGSTNWIAIRKMIADITQVKKDEVKEEEKQIVYYVPMPCQYCSLYIEEQEREKQNRLSRLNNQQ